MPAGGLAGQASPVGGIISFPGQYPGADRRSGNRTLRLMQSVHWPGIRPEGPASSNNAANPGGGTRLTLESDTNNKSGINN